MSVPAEVLRDAVWLAKLARGSSWPGEMAHRVEIAAERVIESLGEAAMPKRLDDLGAQMLADSRAWFGQAEVHWNEVTHFALGLGGETGEVLDVIKKADVCGGEFADSCEFHAPGKHTREALAAEMADVLTYLLALAASLDIDLLAAYRAKRDVNVERWGDPEAPR